MPIKVVPPASRPNAIPFDLSPEEESELRTGDYQICGDVLKKIKDRLCNFRCDCNLCFAPRYLKQNKALHYARVTKLNASTPPCQAGCLLRNVHTKENGAVPENTSRLRKRRPWSTIKLLEEPLEANAAKGKGGRSRSRKSRTRGPRKKLIVSLLLHILDSSGLNTKPKFKQSPLADGLERLIAELNRLEALPGLVWGDLTFPATGTEETEPLKYLKSIFAQPQIASAFNKYGMRPKGLILGLSESPENCRTGFWRSGGSFTVDLSEAMITGLGRTGPYLCLLGVIERDGEPVIVQVAKHAILNRGVLLPVESEPERTVAYHLKDDKRLTFIKPVFPNEDDFRPDFIVNNRIWIEVQGMNMEEYWARKEKRLLEVDAYCKAKGLELVEYNKISTGDEDFKQFEKDFEEAFEKTFVQPHKSS